MAAPSRNSSGVRARRHSPTRGLRQRTTFWDCSRQMATPPRRPTPARTGATRASPAWRTSSGRLADPRRVLLAPMPAPRRRPPLPLRSSMISLGRRISPACVTVGLRTLGWVWAGRLRRAPCQVGPRCSGRRLTPTSLSTGRSCARSGFEGCSRGWPRRWRRRGRGRRSTRWRRRRGRSSRNTWAQSWRPGARERGTTSGLCFRRCRM
mmetsp:Transcript_1312/g.4547  ORF Transcript_1312/g.4547 Transcript_1312/m.4547 type:complete len:208 (+) Transcript_1312:867-1490(+)